MPKNNESQSVEITMWVVVVAIVMIFFAVIVHKSEFDSNDIGRPELSDGVRGFLNPSSGYSQENAVGSMLKANHPNVSDDRIKSGAKKIINEWNEATRK